MSDNATATTVILDTIAKTSAAALALTATLPPADRLRTLRDLKKRVEADEKIAAEIVKGDHHPSIGAASFAYRSEVAGSTSWKAVAEKLAADAGVALDDAFCAAFKGAPSTRVEVRELYDLVSLLKERPQVCAIDLETNGFVPSDGVVQICIRRFDFVSGEEVGRSSLIHLEGRPYRQSAAAVHGISEGELEKAPRWAQIAEDFTSLLKGVVLVGHNLPFEIRFLEAMGVKRTWVAEVDTMVVAQMQMLGLESYRLDAMAEAYNQVGRSGETHDAAEDAQIALYVFLEQATAAGAL